MPECSRNAVREDSGFPLLHTNPCRTHTHTHKLSAYHTLLLMSVKLLSLLNPSLQRLRCSCREIFGDTEPTRSHTCGLLLWRQKVMRYTTGAIAHVSGQWWGSYAAWMTLAIAPACACRSQKNNAHFARTSVHLLLANHHSKREGLERERMREWDVLIHSRQKLLPLFKILNISLFLWLCSESNTSVLLIQCKLLIFNTWNLGKFEI